GCPDRVDCCGSCKPDCASKACGGDGCGGSCGDCSEGLTCSQGACVKSPPIEEFGKACETDGDCYTGLVCRDMLMRTGVRICTMECTAIFAQGECPDGWTCFPGGIPGLPGTSGVCISGLLPGA
ncbi:MAG: hypothetical protein FJ087_22245, partial [Deltaproteobacteria bacterium]|nr:hypothetical protein [Deltaproteobacteria bacterium]